MLAPWNFRNDENIDDWTKIGMTQGQMAFDVISDLFKMSEISFLLLFSSTQKTITNTLLPIFMLARNPSPHNERCHKKDPKQRQKKLSCAHSQGRLSHTNRQLKAARLKRGVNSGPAKMALITGLFPRGTKVGGFSTKFFRPTWFITIRQSSIEQWNLLNTL